METEAFRKFSIDDLRLMLAYRQRQYTENTFYRLFGVRFSKKELEDAIVARLAEVVLLGDDDSPSSVELKEPENNCSVCYGNSFNGT